MGNSDAARILFGECPAQQGMHFCAQEHIFCELIDPTSGKVISMRDGAEGELVYASSRPGVLPGGPVSHPNGVSYSRIPAVQSHRFSHQMHRPNRSHAHPFGG